MHRPQEQVRDFHLACSQPAPEEPFFSWDYGNSLSIKLICEETAELEDAIFHEKQHEAIKEACDLLYVVYGWATAMGVDLEPYFDAVHRSNMIKSTGPKRDDGKQLKPIGWQKPNLEDVTRRLINRSKMNEAPSSGN